MAGQGSPVIVDLDGTLSEMAPRVLRYLVARLGDASLAEEIAQESLAALVRRWRNGGAPESAEAFVFAVARRRLGRAVWRRRLWVPIEQAIGSRDGRPSPESHAIARVEEERVRSALAKLARRDREAILLVAVGETSMAEAANVLGVSLSAVKMRVHRARTRLAALLEAQHGTTPTG
jgi:RNA polymerase sigma-70 factor (ECF subfamily)